MEGKPSAVEGKPSAVEDLPRPVEVADLIPDRSVLAPHAARRWATTHPERVALQHVDGESLTYGRLDEEGRRWADGLRRCGVSAGTHVATFLPSSFDSFRAMLGLAWNRAVEVPVNPAFVGRPLHHALFLADVELLLTVENLLPALAAVADDLPALKTVVVVDREDLATTAPLADDRIGLLGRDDFLGPAVAATDLAGPELWDLAALLFTSGTTGPSKAVRMPWGAIYQNWSWVPEDALRPGEGLHCALPLFHNSGRSAFNSVLARGGRLVTREKFSATSVWDEVRRTDCSTLALVGPLTGLLYSAPERHDDADNPVRHVILGPMIAEIEDFEKRFGVRVCVAYGQTEIGCPISSGWDHGPASACGRATTTYPWPEVRIVDEHDRPLGPGQPGELIVRARAPWGLNLGYHNMDAETAVAWRNGWFHSGDVLRYDEDGNFYFVDRLNDAIRRRGENISSFEIESYVGEHPAVSECAAVGIPTPLGDQEILVAVVTATGTALDPKELHRFLEGRIPTFMVPRYVEIYDDLPRSETTGRVRKQAIRERGLSASTWDRDA